MLAAQRSIQHDCLLSRGTHYCSEANIKAFKELLIRAVRKELCLQDKIVLQKLHNLLNDCRVEHHVADVVLPIAVATAGGLRETPQSRLEFDQFSSGELRSYTS